MLKCSKEFSLTVAAGVASLKAYYTFESKTDPPDNSFLDSTTAHRDLYGGPSDETPVGKVGNCSQSGLLSNAGGIDPFIKPSLGVTICGWYRIYDLLNFNHLSIDLRSFAGLFEFNLSKGPLALFPNDLSFIINDAVIDPAHLPYPVDTNWHFFRVWYDPADNKGRFQLDNSGTIAVTTNAYPYGGADGGFVDISQYFVLLDELGIWNKVLSDTEVTGLWNGGNGVTYPNVPP